jgi:hypothetical protein
MRSQLGLGIDAKKKDCEYRLKNIKERTLNSTGLCEERLEEIILERCHTMKQKQWLPLEHHGDDFFKLSWNISGIRYVSIRIASYWLEHLLG